MATAGSIVIDLLLKTGSLETDTKRAEKRLQEMEKTAKKWGAAIGVAAVAAGAAFTAWAVKMADTGKELDRFATLTNTSSETFQKWAYGAKSVGIEQEKLADILKDVQDRVGDFITTGGGPMADFFENIAPKIGLTADAFRNLSGPEALQLFTSSLEKAGLSQAEMIFYMEAMASDSSLLIPLMKDNAAGMKAMGDEAERLGGIMSDSTVQAAKELDRNIDKLTTMMNGLSIELANSTLPVLNQFITNAINAATETDGLHSQVKDLAGDSALPAWLDSVGTGLARVADVAVAVGKVISAVHSSFQAVSADVNLASSRYGLGMDMTWATSKVFPGVEENTTALKDALDERNKVVADANKEWAELWSYQGNAFENAWKEAANTIKLAQNDVKLVDLTAPLTGGGGKAKGGKSSKSAKEDRPIVFNNMEQLLEMLGEDGVTVLESFQLKAEDTFDSVGEFSLEAARGIQQSLGDGLYDILSGNFDNIGSKFGDMITRMAADAAAANLAKALFGDYDKSGQIGGILGNIAGSLFGNAMTGVTAQSGINLNDTLRPSSNFTAFDSGGFTGHGGKYDPAGIVHKGEVVFSQDDVRRNGGVSRVESMRLRGYSGGGVVGGSSAAGMPSVAVNITNTSGQQVTTGQPKVSMDSLGRLVIDVMLEDLRKNGTYARQLKGAM